MNSDDLRARDHEARRAAQTVFDRPLVLEAGAGTGKTTTLVARLLVWTLGPGWESAREHADRRSVDRSEELGHHTTDEEADRAALFAYSGNQPR